MKAIWILVLIISGMVLYGTYQDDVEVVGWIVTIGLLGLTKTYSVIDKM